jgi:DNA-directed RNA polymerase specialized sigma24 family protein
MAWIAERRRQSRFETVVLPHLDAADALARWLMRNDAADGVVQEACLRAFRYFVSYREGDAKSWLLKILRRVCYDWLERNRPAELVPFETAADPDGALNSAPATLDAGALLESCLSLRHCAQPSPTVSWRSAHKHRDAWSAERGVTQDVVAIALYRERE